MGSIRSALYRLDEEYAYNLVDQIDSLEVMAEMLGYEIEIDHLDRDEYMRAFFYMNDTVMFSMRLGDTVGFNVFSKTARDKIEQLKQHGKVETIIELRDGLIIAQSLL